MRQGGMNLYDSDVNTSVFSSVFFTACLVGLLNHLSYRS